MLTSELSSLREGKLPKLPLGSSAELAMPLHLQQTKFPHLSYNHMKTPKNNLADSQSSKDQLLQTKNLPSLSQRGGKLDSPLRSTILEIAASLPAMAKIDDFNDRQNQIDAENEPYHQYEYQTEENESWAGALPVKQ